MGFKVTPGINLLFFGHVRLRLHSTESIRASPSHNCSGPTLRAPGCAALWPRSLAPPDPALFRLPALQRGRMASGLRPVAFTRAQQAISIPVGMPRTAEISYIAPQHRFVKNFHSPPLHPCYLHPSPGARRGQGGHGEKA